jgi:hypothetical protein
MPLDPLLRRLPPAVRAVQDDLAEDGGNRWRRAKNGPWAGTWYPDLVPEFARPLATRPVRSGHVPHGHLGTTAVAAYARQAGRVRRRDPARDGVRDAAQPDSACGPLRGPLGCLGRSSPPQSRMNTQWPREESNLRSQIRSSRRSQTRLDAPRRIGLRKPIRALHDQIDLGLSRWVWWPRRGPVARSGEVEVLPRRRDS